MKTELNEKDAKLLIEIKNSIPLKTGINIIWHRSTSSKIYLILLILCCLTFISGMFLVLGSMDESAVNVYMLPNNQLITIHYGPTRIYYSDADNPGFYISKIEEDLLSSIKYKFTNTYLILGIFLVVVGLIWGILFVKALKSINHIPEIPRYESRVKNDLEYWQKTGELPIKFEEKYSIYLYRSK